MNILIKHTMTNLFLDSKCRQSVWSVYGFDTLGLTEHFLRKQPGKNNSHVPQLFFVPIVYVNQQYFLLD